MASNVKTEEEILSDLRNFVANYRGNHRLALAPLKREARTKRICDFVFSHPSVFKLEKEIKQVPVDCLTEDVLIKLVLAFPENINLLSEDLITVPVMVAFEFAKRRSEHISALEWFEYGVKFKYPQKIHEVRDSIDSLCDELSLKYNDKDLLRDYDLYVNKVCEHILEFFNKKEFIELHKMEQVKTKYSLVEVNTDRKVLVLISGCPDSGKTTFGRMLSYKISNSTVFDSDVLVKKGRLLDPLEKLVSAKTHVVIFSDTYANSFFSEKEMEEFDVVNIVVVPSSIEKMYRHSKFKQIIVYEEYLANEVKNPFYEDYYRDITVTNEYDERIWLEVDKVLEDMSILLDFPLPPTDDQKKLER